MTWVWKGDELGGTVAFQRVLPCSYTPGARWSTQRGWDPYRAPRSTRAGGQGDGSNKADRSISLAHIPFCRHWPVFLEAAGEDSALRHRRERCCRCSCDVCQQEQEPSPAPPNHIPITKLRDLASLVPLVSIPAWMTPRHHDTRGDEGDFSPFLPHIHQAPRKSG